MRKLNTNKNENTEVFAVDERGPGGANHHYEVHGKIKTSDLFPPKHIFIFQKGPLKENPMNGIQNEDLIAIVIDRLNGFQKGDFECIDNAKALVNLYGALVNLRNRTKERERRGVEGTSAI